MLAMGTAGSIAVSYTDVRVGNEVARFSPSRALRVTICRVRSGPSVNSSRSFARREEPTLLRGACHVGETEGLGLGGTAWRAPHARYLAYLARVLQHPICDGSLEDLAVVYLFLDGPCDDQTVDRHGPCLAKTPSALAGLCVGIIMARQKHPAAPRLACASVCGFQSGSNSNTRSAPVRFNPTPPCAWSSA